MVRLFLWEGYSPKEATESNDSRVITESTYSLMLLFLYIYCSKGSLKCFWLLALLLTPHSYCFSAL